MNYTGGTYQQVQKLKVYLPEITLQIIRYIASDKPLPEIELFLYEYLQEETELLKQLTLRLRPAISARHISRPFFN